MFTCSFCRRGSGEQVVVLSCGHAVHKDCLPRIVSTSGHHCKPCDRHVPGNPQLVYISFDDVDEDNFEEIDDEYMALQADILSKKRILEAKVQKHDAMLKIRRLLEKLSVLVDSETKEALRVASSDQVSLM